MGLTADDDSDQNTQAWLVSNKKRRVLKNPFYTDYGTEIFVEDGLLVEQKRSSSDHNPSRQIDPEFGCNGILCSSPPGSPSPRDSKEHLEEITRKQTKDVALTALSYFNKKHHVDYELVEGLDSAGRCLDDGLWYHCNFTAKPRASSQCGNGDSSTKLFFAEMKRRKSHRTVTACRIIDDTKTKVGCEICNLLHPRSGFRKGLYQYKPRVLRHRN